MSDLLALLKRLVGRNSPMNCCPECDYNLADGIHEPDCELKAQIDKLEAEEASQNTNEGHA
jgi:hypothetical protein